MNLIYQGNISHAHIHFHRNRTILNLVTSRAVTLLHLRKPVNKIVLEIMTWLIFQRFYSCCFIYLQFQAWEKRVRDFIVFFVCYLAAPQPTLGHFTIRLKSHCKRRKVVGSLSPASYSVFEQFVFLPS